MKSLIFCPGRLKTRLFVIQEGGVGGVRVEGGGGIEGTCFLGRMQAAGVARGVSQESSSSKISSGLRGGSEWRAACPPNPPPPHPTPPERNPCR